MRGWTLHAHCRPRPPRFHVCSIAALFRVLDSTRPCLGDTTHSLGIGSFNSVSFHLHRPGHPLPISQSRAATTSPVASSYVSTLRAHHHRLSILFLLRPEPLFFRSMSHHHCPHAPGSGMPSIPTFAWHVPAWASNKVGPHSRVDTCPPTSPRALPLSTLPCIQNKKSWRPSCGPVLCSQPVIIDTFVFPALPAEQRHLSSQLTSPHSFLFLPVALVISDHQTPCHSFLLTELPGRIYIHIHTHIYIHKPFKLLVGPHVASLLQRPLAKYTKYLSCILLSPPRSVDPQARTISEDALVQNARPSSNLRGLGASCTRRRSRGPYAARS